MQKKEKIFIGLLVAMFLVIPGISASLNVPITNTNYTAISFNCTQATLEDAGNASIFYNATGGAAETYLGIISNTTANQTDFTSSSISIEALDDGLLYNFTCAVFNGTDWENSSVEAVGVDNTDPTYTLTLAKPSRADYKSTTQSATWTTADATSGVETVAVTSTSPNTDTCPTQSWSDTSATSQQLNLDCVGTYTVSLTVTDNAGNSASTTDTFKTYAPGYKDASSGAGTFSAFSIGGENGAKGNLTTFAIIAIIILVIWAFNKK